MAPATNGGRVPGVLDAMPSSTGVPVGPFTHKRPEWLALRDLPIMMSNAYRPSPLSIARRLHFVPARWPEVKVYISSIPRLHEAPATLADASAVMTATVVIRSI